MVATMVINNPTRKAECKTTLIVVPAALMEQVCDLLILFYPTNSDLSFQWKEEIETKTNNLFNVHIHHGKDKLKVGFLCLFPSINLSRLHSEFLK